jgi:hypothetical protein
MQALRRPERLRTLFAALALLTVTTAYAAEDRVIAAAFSAARPGTALPAGWVPLEAANIKVRTRYTLVDDNGTTVLRAESERGASGLSRPLRINPTEQPWLRWRWKISNIIETADLRTKDGDDFPARVYVMFDYPLERLSFMERNKLRMARTLFDPNLPAATLCYVWDGKAAADTIASSAYTDRVKVIVVESGASRVKQWVDVERNIARDFRAAFGEEAPPVSAIAVATDTDNTGTFAIAHFGDISFNKHKVTTPPTSAGTKP